jgi:SAM-dependent methyltransferase
MFIREHAANETRIRSPNTDRASLILKLRAHRFAKVRELIEDALEERGQARILDLGGIETCWHIGEDFLSEHRGRLKITLVNLPDEARPVRDSALFTAIRADVTSPTLLPGEHFDLVHAHSVIEHVGSWDRMVQFAKNVKRLGKRYYVQTPNYWFPYEPHFRAPGFQYLPESLRIALIRRFALGFFKRIESYEEARDIIRRHHIISTRQVRRLFNDAEISHERVMGLKKSIIAIRR